ncbi:MAG: hypothetical protein NXI27_15910 [Alphaproteobacteria bacterium]|nr:hypothetical protein [Alphaproteobacteria bacterium]
MTILRTLCIALFAIVAIYTVIVVANHGANLLPVYFADLFSVTWTGQFVLDFTTYLVLSALWVAWRHQFSAFGIGLGLLAGVGGMPVFSIYLIVAIGAARGDVRVLLLGPARAGGDPSG